MTRILLKPRRAMPFIYRHPWVFSGAVDRIDGALKSGDVVEVVGDRGDLIGRGLYSAESQIAVRLVSWQPDEAIDDAFFRRRVAEAVALRERLAPLSEGQTARRVVFSEADGLPGLIVDQYGEWLVAQFLSFGLDQRREVLLGALEEQLHPRGIFERSDVDVREKEGLPRRAGLARGAEPPERIPIHDGGLAFEVDVRAGQKTGHYLDQRENRAAAARFAPGRTVLDAYCYSGGFGIAASKGGASRVVCLDSSRPALDLARRNADRNACTNVEFLQTDAVGFLRQQAERSLGMVVLDPPGLARAARNVDSVLALYADLYAASMRALEADGVLTACCCSQHIAPDQILRTLNAAAVHANRRLRVVGTRGQPADHPVAANCPETAYLKCFICWVS